MPFGARAIFNHPSMRKVLVCVIFIVLTSAVDVVNARSRTSREREREVDADARSGSATIASAFAMVLGAGAMALKKPVIRARALSFVAVGVMCAWYVVVRAVEYAKKRALAPEEREEREQFDLAMKAFKTKERESGREEDDREQEIRFKLAESVAEKRRANGYARELKKLRASVPVEDLHEDQIVSSGNRELDVTEAYERALVAAGMNATKAALELMERAKWHAEHSVTRTMKNWKYVDKKKRDGFLASYQGAWYTANTPLGIPVYIERLGGVDIKKTFEVVSEHDVVDQRMRLQGYLTKILLPHIASREGVIARDKMIHIIDLKGASAALVSKANLVMFRRLQEIDRNFPEFLYRTYLVNAPIGARIVWRTIAPLLPSRVRAKVKIMGELKGKNMQKIAEIMGGESKVPYFLGGGCSRRLDQCPPWCLPHMNDTTFIPWELDAQPPSMRSPEKPKRPKASVWKRVFGKSE